MKVRDRFSGSLVDLPDSVESGRYELAGADVSFNGHSAIKAGDLLMDDGSSDCKLDNQGGLFKRVELSNEESARLELITRAVLTIAGIHNEKDDILPSPLLPQEITELSELLPLENMLSEIFNKGHLQEIARSPRLDMQYQESMTHVSRARRLALSAERKLASDTSCWQQRTLSGVIPKRILALFSNDDYTIYENRLYARLIDRLEKRLMRRLSEVNILLNNLEESQKFDSSSQYYRLRNDICSIWGETFDEHQTLARIKMSKHAVETIEYLLRAVRALKESNLYASIPLSMRVPDQIHMTNILTHDQHYRYIVPLWKSELELAAKAKMTPAERYIKNNRQLDAYINYVGILLKRALRQLTNNSSAIHYELHLTRSRREWRVTDIRGESLLFVPMIDSAGGLFQPVASDKEQRIPVFLLGSYAEFNPLAIINKIPLQLNVVLTPLDFLVEEKVVTLLRAWSWHRLCSDYGKEIVKVPTKVCQFVAGMDGFIVTGSKVLISRPVQNKISESLQKILAENAAENIRQEFSARIADLKSLSICQNCGKIARFDARGNNAFKATCDHCILEWGVFTENGIRKALFSIPGYTSDSFDRFGRWHMELLL